MGADSIVEGLPGNGSSDVLVGSDKGKHLVILRFPKPMLWIGCDPENTMMIAGAMAKEAYTLRFNKPPADTELSRIFGDIRKEVTKEIRDMLVNRVILMRKGMDEQHRSPLFQAEAIVDQILSASR